MNAVRVIPASRLRERGTWAVDDWIFAPGSRVLVDGARHGLVARQDDDDLWVSYPQCVPGTSTELAYTLPELVHIDRVRRVRRRPKPKERTS